ncbi:unnamed protein product [Polarella glacialis]|uniref:Uncharacterized protein n=1 Tax=Polarella glacialis TaxID=89957 RepID=A0A813HVP8_POLGL|nr:unnamed protein product [Polarella glacialis]
MCLGSRSRIWTRTAGLGFRFWCFSGSAAYVGAVDEEYGNRPVATGVDTTSVATGYYKWDGMAAFGDKLYAAPWDAEHLLIYDTGTGQVSGVSTAAVATGVHKWSGICALGTKAMLHPRMLSNC